MCRASSFFSMSNDAQFESGAIQDTRILTGSAFDAPCARSEIAATIPINQDRTNRICPPTVATSRVAAERLGQPFVIENRSGAASNVGTEAVVNAAPDGYTVLTVSSPQAINATLYDKLH